MLSDMKKILLVCSHYPIPENIGTNMRTMNFVRFFKNYGTIDIAYSNILSEDVQTGKSFFSNEYFLKREAVKSFQGRLIRWTNIKDRPLQIPKYDDVSEKQLLTLIESNGYDYIVVRYVINTWSLFKLESKYKMQTIVDFDDILSGSLYESEIASVNGLFRKFRLRVNQKFLINYEKNCLDFGASLFCSEKDRTRIAGRNGRGNTFVVPNIYYNKSFEDYNFVDGFLNENILLFVGGLMYQPNVEGLKWFIESVFYDFKKRYPDAKLLLVGHSPDYEIKKLSESEAGIELYANVPDIKKYYKKCKAFVVPLLAGGGTRIKILEAALANRPVLSTPIGAEGMDFRDGENILFFGDADGFLAQYAKLLDENRYQSLIRSARQTVLSNYSLEKFKESMARVLRYIDEKRK